MVGCRPRPTSPSLQAARLFSAACNEGLVGSNILDVLVPIGIAALIVPIEFASSLLKLDVPVLFALCLLVVVFLRLPAGVGKPQAVVLLLSYSGYLITKTVLV